MENCSVGSSAMRWDSMWAYAKVQRMAPETVESSGSGKESSKVRPLVTNSGCSSDTRRVSTMGRRNVSPSESSLGLASDFGSRFRRECCTILGSA